jgi:hypothetical protein
MLSVAILQKSVWSFKKKYDNMLSDIILFSDIMLSDKIMFKITLSYQLNTKLSDNKLSENMLSA